MQWASVLVVLASFMEGEQDMFCPKRDATVFGFCANFRWLASCLAVGFGMGSEETLLKFFGGAAEVVVVGVVVVVEGLTKLLVGLEGDLALYSMEWVGEVFGSLNDLIDEEEELGSLNSTGDRIGDFVELAGGTLLTSGLALMFDCFESKGESLTIFLSATGFGRGSL